MRAFRWTFGVMLALVFPAAVAVAVVTYVLLRRRWPDRGLAVALCGLAGLATFGALSVADYWGAWARIASDLVLAEGHARFADWATLVGFGPLLGPVLGAVVWLVWQPFREHLPYNGVDERERRRRAEERRRLFVTHTVQRVRHTRTGARSALVAPAAVGLGDAAGPVVGRFQRGDLPGPWRTARRVVRLPMAHPNNRHLLILGATGLGKTETALTLAEWGARQGWQVVYLTCKEPPSPGKSAAPRLAAVAADLGGRFCTLAAAHTPYDPMRGPAAEVRDRLIRIEEWGDRYWAAVANTLVAVALELNAEQGQAIDALPDLVYSLVRTRLVELAKKSRDHRVAELVDAFNYGDLGGALMRYASMAIHLRGWIGPGKAGGWAFEDADLACIELPTVSRPEAATALMRLVLRDFGSYLVDPARRQTTADGRPRKVLMVIEEAGAVAGDPVIGREFVNQVERNRDADAYSVLTAQDPAGFGGGRTWSALSTNAVVLSYRQTEQAEQVAKLAGTERVTEAGADYDSDGRITHQGVARRQHAFKLNPQMLRELGRGEFVIISAGRYAKVVGTLPALSYRLPDVPAVRRAYEALERSRQAAVPPEPPAPAPAGAGNEDQEAVDVADAPAGRSPVIF